MAEVRRISKSGNSSVVVLPKPILKAIGLHVGEIVMLETIDNTIVISRAQSSRQLFDKAGKRGGKARG